MQRNREKTQVSKKKNLRRFVAMYPEIATKERKYIPDALLQYVKNETDIK